MNAAGSATWAQTLAKSIATSHVVDSQAADVLRAGDATISTLKTARNTAAAVGQLVDEGLSMYRLHGSPTEGGVQLLQTAGERSSRAFGLVDEWIANSPSARSGVDELVRDIQQNMRQLRFSVDTVLPGA